MSQSSSSVSKALKTKQVLLVDDKPITIIPYWRELRKVTKSTQYTESLSEAMALLDTAGENRLLFDIVLIDLYMPPIPSALRKYASQLTIAYNEGQSLGLWLSEMYPEILYAYLTAIPQCMDKSVGNQNKILVIDKNIVDPTDIGGELKKLLLRF